MICDTLVLASETLEIAIRLSSATGYADLAHEIAQHRTMLRQLARHSDREDVFHPDGAIVAAALRGLASFNPLGSVDWDPRMRSFAARRIADRISDLRPGEIALLTHFLENQDTMQPSKKLLLLLKSRSMSDSVVRVLICRLRKRLDEAGLPSSIATCAGGYVMPREKAAAILSFLS